MEERSPRLLNPKPLPLSTEMMEKSSPKVETPGLKDKDRDKDTPQPAEPPPTKDNPSQPDTPQPAEPPLNKPNPSPLDTNKPQLSPPAEVKVKDKVKDKDIWLEPELVDSLNKTEPALTEEQPEDKAPLCTIKPELWLKMSMRDTW